MTVPEDSPDDQPTPGSDDLGERLAGWLEELDLAPHLGAAGLPTFRARRGGAGGLDRPRHPAAAQR